MSRPLTVFSGQWADLPCETLCQMLSKSCFVLEQSRSSTVKSLPACRS